MRRFRYQAYGVMQPKTPGAGTDLEIAIIENRSIYDTTGGTDLYSWPLAIQSTLAAEGTDIPVYSRFYTAIDPSPWPHAARRRSYYRALAASAYNLGMTTPVFEAPPDTTPLIAVESLEIPSTAYHKRWKVKWWLAQNAMSPVPGYYAEFTPAGEYSDVSCRLLSEIQRHMLEGTIDGGITWSLWTQEEVLTYFNQRLVRFTLETGLIQKRATVSAPSGTGEVSLPTDEIDLKRVAWNTGSAVSSLVTTDNFVQDHGKVGWSATTGTPYAYVEEITGPLSLQLVPTPSANGTVDILYVAVPTTMTGVCTKIPIPSFLTPYIKYGIMADMLMKQGEANDPDRAEYCEDRFREGVEVVKAMLGVK